MARSDAPGETIRENETAHTPKHNDGWKLWIRLEASCCVRQVKRTQSKKLRRKRNNYRQKLLIFEMEDEIKCGKWTPIK